MELFPIHGSARIARYGWQEDRGVPGFGTLALQFVSGAMWYYLGVPERKLELFLLAESKGRYFAREIQPFYEGVDAADYDRGQTGI